MNPKPTSKGAAIDLEAISKAYGGFKALDGVSLRIEPGEFMTLLGPSGSGKTTTLNVIAGFTDVTSGKLLVGEKSVVGVPAHKRNIGVVFQHYALFPHMSVGRNVAYPLTLRGVDQATRQTRVARALDMVKMGDFAHRYPSELSGGQQQRVALARAIVFDPPLLLMDEPLGALDKKLREWLQLEIKRIHRELGTTFVYVTHDQEEALVLSDRIAVFNRGRIEQVGTGRQLYDEPATLFVGRFIGDSTVLRGKARSDGNSTALSIAGETVTVPRKLSGEASPVMLLRPEKLAIRRAGQSAANGANRLSGTIAEAIYLGSESKYEVKLADGSAAIVRSPLTGESFGLGDKVELCFDGSDAKLLADDASADTTLT
ncbi:ABC transporter ATP-binding protein [Mesorhizobium sp. LSJC268A00]|uniref:ABC transporter ATP-binding protein n=1 Tax=unclassified Mesorhizobium TaxID=325217 RepID=UPI0003CE7F20|nr:MULTISPECIES: ABC transporter ATP-binding protein [unclassified Mesorhizobium]ESW93297.1 ABC transporter ATP-binding protein [Mesorhizobium sp. LSJC269B00]ESX06716.1 ABC transporter ATP-binding protein [Mesorhizobium sp. LSJC268A00]ESX13582.1 ABC transporter ATP-binding protein [Mesorhizobium sp. LSJC265A00]ESX32020.1 ABC transporter ATP-binding protein [Mesorhizobium sp. LSHC440B00]ESX39265.1 ABC transporter ATP-binding protein [Mesorhizobium sp. LSHC432A00]